MAYFSNLVQSVSQVISSTASVAANYTEDLKSNYIATSSLSGLPYKIVPERVPLCEGGYLSKVWCLYDGFSKEDNSPVSIWIHNDPAYPNPNTTTTTATNVGNSNGYRSVANEESYYELASNALKKLRTVRHPNLLTYKDGLGIENGPIYIVTERVQPLLKSIDPIQFNLELDGSTKDLVTTFALYKVANALKFLNETCALTHGAVSLETIFVTQGLDFKLAGFELLSKLDMNDLKSADNFIFNLAKLKTLHNCLPNQLSAVSDSNNLDSVRNYLLKDSVGLDMFRFGALFYEFSLQSQFDSSNYSTKLTKSTDRTNLIKKLLHPNQKLRFKSYDQILASNCFNQPLIEVDKFLDEINFKEPDQLNTFFTGLTSLTSNFPNQYLQHKLLPQLITAVEFGNGGQQALTVLLDLATKLDDDVFELVVIPPLLRLFQSNDRKLRFDLLLQFSRYQQHFSSQQITKTIFKELLIGFKDSNIQIRELTLKATILLADRLSNKQINDDLLPSLYKLQFDPYPTIRANTIVGLGKLFQFVDTVDLKVSFPKQLVRSLDDPFPPCKLNCVKVLTLTADTIQTEYLVQQLLPSIIKKLLDQDKNLREAANKLVDVLLMRVKEVAAKMPDNPPPPPPSQQPGTTIPSNGNVNSAAEGWTGWAVNSLGKAAAYSVSSATSIASTTPSESVISPPTTNRIINQTDSIRVQSKSDKFSADANPGDDDEADADGWDGWPTEVDHPTETKVNKLSLNSSRKVGTSMKLTPKSKSNKLTFADMEEVEQKNTTDDGGWDSWGQEVKDETTTNADPEDDGWSNWGQEPTETEAKTTIASPSISKVISPRVVSPKVNKVVTKPANSSSNAKGNKLSLAEKRMLHKQQKGSTSTASSIQKSSPSSKKAVVVEKEEDNEDGWDQDW